MQREWPPIGCDNALCDNSFKPLRCVDYIVDECCLEYICPNGEIYKLVRLTMVISCFSK